MTFRMLIGVFFAAPITIGLFLLMQFLVTPDRSLIDEVVEAISIDITRAQREEDSDTNRENQRPDVEDQPPPPPPMDTRTERPDLGGLSVGIPDIDLNINTGGVGPIEGDIQPLVRVFPVYPMRARERGIEGEVCVRFTVSPEGTVVNPEVYRTVSTLLNRSLIRAVSGFRYQPKIENGQPVSRPNVQYCFTYEFDD